MEAIGTSYHFLTRFFDPSTARTNIKVIEGNPNDIEKTHTRRLRQAFSLQIERRDAMRHRHGE